MSRFSESSFSKKQTGKFKQSSIPKYVVRNVTKTETPIFHDLLIRMTVANGWAFQWINNSSTHALFNWLNPHLKLPDRKQLAGSILDKAIENIENARKDKLNQVHE